MKKIYIDTSNNEEIIIGLFIEDKKYILKQKLAQRKAQIVLPLIDSLLKEHKTTLQEITHIEVNPGPGSFTGVRVGVTVANALGFALGIPVNEKESIEPVY